MQFLVNKLFSTGGPGPSYDCRLRLVEAKLKDELRSVRSVYKVWKEVYRTQSE